LDERELALRALSGDAAATRKLVVLVLPVVQARIARMLVRRKTRAGRDVRQEVEDLAQEVFAALFESDGRVLRAWDPARGLGLASFCGLIAEREVSSILRSGRRSPWSADPTEADVLEKDLTPEPDFEARLATREQLELLVDRVREVLSPLGLEMFERLVVQEEAVESVCTTTGMKPDAVYAWKSRLGKLVRKIAREIAISDPNISVSDAKVSTRRPEGEETS
jgi:DNA-directed RNA polymerase specialized sigma24 family protein